MSLEVNPQAEARFRVAADERGIEPSLLFEEMLNSYPPKREGQETPPKGQRITLGMFPQLAGLDLEDFKIAEFHGDDDDGLDWTE